MKTIKLLIAIWVVLFSLPSISQDKVSLDALEKKGEGKKSAIFSAACVGFRNPPSQDLKWKPVLIKKRIDHESDNEMREKIERIKEEKMKLKLASMGQGKDNVNKNNSVTPEIGTNFLGNTNNGSSPMDNSIAISDGGWIVSVANTTIEYDDINGNNTYFASLLDFIGDPGITNVCDPVAYYDRQADRFIVFAQECSGNPNNSALLVLFSQTNNPNDGFWYYNINGNPLDDGTWFDYPKLAVSNNELYITGNLFNTEGVFSQAILFQIDKNAGYDGAFMNWMYWYDIDGNPFTLCPVSQGHGASYGPGVYLVATSAGGASTVKFYNLTDDLGQGANLEYFEIARDAYSVAAPCPQQGSSCNLDNGDCRTLSGFYMNGIVHYAFTSDAGNGWNGLNYSRLDLSTGNNNSSIFGFAGTYDYAYPSVVSFSNSASDHSVMIGFGSVSSNIYPQVRVVNCDEDMNWSPSTLVKAGNSYSCYTSTTSERWGDYTGSARKHNSGSPSVWINGMYGTSNNNWNTWISEVHAGAVGIDEIDGRKDELSVYPNPVVDRFILEFNLEQSKDLAISILDVEGKIVQELFSGKGNVGENLFSFNKANLSNGTYFVVIKSSDNKIIANERIIINY